MKLEVLNAGRCYLSPLCKTWITTVIISQGCCEIELIMYVLRTELIYVKFLSYGKCSINLSYITICIITICLRISISKMRTVIPPGKLLWGLNRNVGKHAPYIPKLRVPMKGGNSPEWAWNSCLPGTYWVLPTSQVQRSAFV